MALIKEICETKYIEELHSINILEDIIADNIYTYAKKKSKVMNDFLEGYATAKIDGIIELYYSVDILDVEQFMYFDIYRCFRGE